MGTGPPIRRAPKPTRIGVRAAFLCDAVAWTLAEVAGHGPHCNAIPEPLPDSNLVGDADQQFYVRDSSAAAMVGDEPCANRNKDAVWRFDTLRRSPSVYCPSLTSRSRRNSNVFLVPKKTARRSVTTRCPKSWASRCVPTTTLWART